jgi:hypothetical protein
LETKTHLVLVGFGQNRIHLIPAVMAICNDLPELKVTIIDKKSFEFIIGERKLLTEEQIDWCKERFVQENVGSEVVTDKLLFREILRADHQKGFQRIFYLSLPPEIFESTIKKYSGYADIFIIEKPWALDQASLRKIVESSSSSKILGIDHYLWKPKVRQFLKDMQLEYNSKLLLESHSLDFVLCESDLDSKDRIYFWKTGVAVDMIPHVMPLLDRLLDNRIRKVSIRKATPGICDDIIVNDVLNKNNNVSTTGPRSTAAIKFDVKETFAEIIMILYLESGQSKLVHVVLGKGITVPSILVCDERSQFQKFLYCSFGNIFLDLSNYNIELKRDKKVSNEIESPWYYMFTSLIRKEYNCFLDIEFIQKYVSLYGSILNRFNDSVLEVTGKQFTSGYARLLLNYDEFRYAKGEEFHLKLIHPGCCFTNNYVNKL